MAEVKNSFTSSKMNQDLDDRLVPSNEYREGRNISIISSDSSNTGSIENILGNELVSNLILNFESTGFEIIGYTYDQTAGILYVMATNYTDTSLNQLDNPQSYMWATNYSVYENTSSRIIRINLNNNEIKTLVDGKFLNFSKTHPITGINLIENLLFWTDNRNQPRKINIDTAYNNSGYYSIEDQISVAKYAPISSIEFLNDVSQCTMRDVVSEFLPDNEDNPYWNEDYAGDPSYLLDKFVRFSYRFRFDDGEYSILAPFSQIAFIPQQDGSFITTGTLSDENETYRSSIVSFMRNKVNEIGLIIPLPVAGASLKGTYKVDEIDIIYKESDSLAIQILDTISSDELSNIYVKYYNYNYQSRKPKTTLSNDQLLRVYDKVPVRALAQETSGGRIIYGNYIDKHTPPTVINYKVGVSAKLAEGDISIEYPLHTLKQNRNYQVGIILSDKFGRQSDVILSSITNGQTTDGIFFGGSSFYSPYLSPNPNVLTFFGNSIKVLFTNIITSDRQPLNDRGVPATGAPGLYAEGSLLESFSVTNTPYNLVPGTYNHTPAQVLSGPLNGSTIAYFDVVVGSGGIVTSIVLNESVREVIIGAEAKLYAIPRQSTVTDGRPIIIVNSVTKENPTGWYSYKIVVKQTQQEYYNVYLPGALSGYPDPADSIPPFPTGEDSKTSHVVLFSDNINKVPRDLSEVGPDQKQYRSSVRLFGRVENDSATSNTQFIPTKEGFSVPTLANASDLTMSASDIDTDGNFYQLNTNPIIGRISTNGTAFGVTNATMVPYLAVLETNPIVSNIDIYWETSSTGIISELNNLIAQDIEGAYSFVDINYSQFEWQDPSGVGDVTGTANCKYVTDWFYPVTYVSDTLVDTTASLISVTNANNDVVTDYFALETDTIGGINKYRIKIINNFYYNIASNLNQFNFILSVTDPTSSTTNNITIKGDLENIDPTIDAFTPPVVYTGTTNIYTFTGVNGSFGNIPTSPPYTSTTTSDLKWTFENGTQVFTGGIGVSEFTLTINARINANSVPGHLAVTSGNPRTLETPTIVLTDSGNAIDTATLSLDFRPGEFNPTEFNLDFNL